MAKRSINTLTIAAACVSATAFFDPADAGPTAPQLLAAFGDIIGVDAATTSEIVGPALIGQNLGGHGILDTSKTPVNLAGFPAGEAYIYGSNSGTWAESGQTIFVGGANTGSFLAAGAGSVLSNYGFPTSFASIWNTLTSYSAALAAMPATGTFDPVTATFSGGTVFDVTTAELAASHGIINGLAAGDIINVTGSTWTEGLTYGGFPDGTIWNFVDATNLTFDEFQGTVIAPDATVTNTAPIEGDLVALDYIGDGELHWNPPDAPADVPNIPLPVDEPAVLDLIAIGIALIVAWRFRRGNAAA